MKIINVVGARPNFMKIAPIVEAIDLYNEAHTGGARGAGGARIDPLLLHTGQHYDALMSRLFFDELGIPRPEIDLGVGSGTHAAQTAEVMKRFEPVLASVRPDCILVVGDVNSTIACALTASKLGVKVVHVEAGLRSFDRSMPEEINRLLTDAISDILFTTEKSAEVNLLREGVDPERIFFVGNVMIDTLVKNVEKAKGSDVLYRTGLLSGMAAGAAAPPAAHGSPPPEVPPYAVLTLHRPSNVDDPSTLSGIIEALAEAAGPIPVVFPAHPRTVKRTEEFGLGRLLSKKPASGPGIFLTEPLGYLDFLHLMANSRVVLTDSGGIQEETTILGLPCVTLRENTERPVTLIEGTNRLVGTDKDKIITAVTDALEGRFSRGRVPDLWDGRASERIVKVLVENI
jgi:UDP-N-acetylglucosamine 2-epimerase (non-hydrolysing)